MPSSQTREARADAFVDAARRTHGDRYDYRQAFDEYVSAHKAVTIICPDHGAFTQAPNDHKRGGKCPDCSARRGSSVAARTMKFIAAARVVHGDRYGYDGIVFVDQRTETTILCDVHGGFEQRPDSHLAGRGCPACAEVARQERRLEAAKRRKRKKRRRRS
jgi:hypothetical protein